MFRFTNSRLIFYNSELIDLLRTVYLLFIIDKVIWVANVICVNTIDQFIRTSL